MPRGTQADTSIRLLQEMLDTLQDPGKYDPRDPRGRALDMWMRQFSDQYTSPDFAIDPGWVRHGQTEEAYRSEAPRPEEKVPYNAQQLPERYTAPGEEDFIPYRGMGRGYQSPYTRTGSAGETMEEIFKSTPRVITPEPDTSPLMERRGYRGPEIPQKEFDIREKRDVESGRRPDENEAAGGFKFRGQKGSPDLPAERDIQYMEMNPTDGVLMDYIDRFGFRRLDNPRGEPPGFIPLPPSRYPDLDPNNPLGPASIPPDEIQGQLKPSDLQRMIDENVDPEEIEAYRRASEALR
jgi:hypothetical protein